MLMMSLNAAAHSSNFDACRWCERVERQGRCVASNSEDDKAFVCPQEAAIVPLEVENHQRKTGRLNLEEQVKDEGRFSRTSWAEDEEVSQEFVALDAPGVCR